MKRILTLLLPAFLCACQAPEAPQLVSDDPQPVSADPSLQPAVSDDPVSADPSQTPPASDDPPKTPVLALPGELALTEQGDGIMLAWTDNSYREEGYLVEKAGTDRKTEKFFLPADAESWSDPSVAAGIWTYSVQAYRGLERGEAATIAYTKAGEARLQLKVQTSWYMASARVDVLSDGGFACTLEAAVEGVETQTAPGTFRKGDHYYFNFRNLPQGESLRLSVTLTSGPGQARESAEVTLPADPDPLSVSWSELTEYSLPSSVKLYQASTSVTGKTVNMWYAAMDLSAEDVELRTLKGKSLKTPTAFVTSDLKDEKVWIVINGGYFASPATSYSYIVDGGVELAKNVAMLSRTNGYNITRGVFALDAEAVPTLAWVYSGTWAYDRPLPVYDGGPILTPSASYPAPALEWHPQEAMGGGPILVKDGRYCFDFLQTKDGKYLSNCELFQTDIYGETLRAPRTALGYTDDGRVILLIADGRNSGGSAGLTLLELARIMQGLGCENVLNLDGGGSTMMTVGDTGTLLNHPSDGKQRAVVSYVAILGK